MLIGFVLFIFGLCIGSFINALEYRTETKRTISGRSFCPNCKHKLAWYDLVPILSWISLFGKCRYCKKPISIQYPLIEFITGLSFFGVGIASGEVLIINNSLASGSGVDLKSFISLFLLLIITSIFIFIGLYDYKTEYIKTSYVYAGITASFLYIITVYLSQPQKFIPFVFPYLLSGAIPAIIFFLMYFLSKEKWMGAGDYELAFLIGLFLGWPKVLVGFYFAFIVGAIVGLVKIAFNKKTRLNSQIPFGPFLVFGAIFAFIFGEQLFRLYVKIFLGG